MSVEGQIAQLNQAKLLVDKDPAFYPQIIDGILPIASSNEKQIRAWVADFLNTTFAEARVPLKTRQDLALQGVVGAISILLEERDDVTILKDAISCSASLYPLIFHYVCVRNTQDQKIWSQMVAVKSRILRLWESPLLGVRIACVKFVQRVLLTQTPGMKDPRLADITDPSLTLLPLKHPIITHAFLEAEAQGLLDRLLAITYETATLVEEKAPITNSRPTPLFTAVMNVLPQLVKTRATVAPKVMSALLQIRPQNMGSTYLQRKCIDKQLRIILSNLLRTNSAGSYGPKIGAFLQALPRITASEDRKRPLDLAGDEPSKRARTGTPVSDAQTPPVPLEPTPPPQLKEGEMSYSRFYTLTASELAQLDVRRVLNEEQVVRITMDCLRYVDPGRLQAAIATLRARYDQLAYQQAAIAAAGPIADGEEEEEEFEPAPPAALPLQPFALPSPKPLSQTAMVAWTGSTLDRLLANLPEMAQRNAALGLDATNDIETQEGLTCALARLCSRGPAETQHLARERLFTYVTRRFRERIGVAVGWLTEEWYAEQLEGARSQSYLKWTLRVLDAVLPFLEARDKVFLRFLSELPELDEEILARVKEVCLDPDRSRLGFLALQFLIMLRPPVKEPCLQIVQSLYDEYDEHKTAAGKILQKFGVQEMQACKVEPV